MNGNPYLGAPPDSHAIEQGYQRVYLPGVADPTGNGLPQYAPNAGSFSSPDITGGFAHENGSPMINYANSPTGFAETRANLLGLQQQALAQQAPSIGYGKAQGALGQQDAYEAQQMGDIGAMRAQANALGQMANGGGPSAARSAFTQNAGTNSGAALSAASAGGSPLAMRSALAGLGSADVGAASTYGGQRAAELQAATAATTQARGNIASTLTGVRGQTLGAAGQAAAMAEAPATMQEQQNALDAKTSNAYVQSLLGLNSQEQQSEIGQNQNMENYYLAEQGYTQQQNAQNVSAAMGGLSGLGSLALAFL